jgi:cold shock protein
LALRGCSIETTSSSLPATSRRPKGKTVIARTARRGGNWNMATGTVKWFSSEKGYGFISQEGGPDVFVHYKAIQGQGYRTLEENEPVEFDVQESPKGLQAVNVIRMAMRAGE